MMKQTVFYSHHQEVLLKNLFVSHAGDSLVTVVQNHNRYKLLADFDQTNVILHEIKAGSSVWLTPDPKFPRYMEYYTLLEGELILHCGEEGDTRLSAGDSFYTTGLECDVSIFPQTDLKLLCFSSKPLFNDFMAFVNDLNDLNGQIDRKDHYTFNHSRRVARFALELANRMHIPSDTKHHLLLAALYHDVGKCYMPQELLNKPSQLTPEEYETVRHHPIDSYNLLKKRFPIEVAEIARSHHERLDGSGYPNHLTGDKMPPEVRIISVADTFDAMTSDRPYKKGKPTRQAMDELYTLTNQYDRSVLDVLRCMVEDGTADAICRMSEEELGMSDIT